MKKMICTAAVAPVRAAASHRSEMISQLLFNETCELLEEDKEFVKIKCDYDDYEGWCQKKQLSELINNENVIGYTSAFISSLQINKNNIHVSLATPVFQESDNAKYIKPDNKENKKELIKETSLKYLNVPYLWGGKSVFGIDCSGFAQQVFKLAGIHLLRDAYQQATQGEDIGFLMEAQCGDLAFFDNEEGKITHVGILLNYHQIIHAAGCVRIDTIDTAGIIDDRNERTHKLRTIKRVI